MFDKDYIFKGKHADMVKDLTKEFDVNKNKLFQRNLDVYILAPIIGFLYQRKADLDTNSDNKSTTKVFTSQIFPAQDDLNFNFQLIMLLDKNNEPDVEKRIEKAFRGNNSEDDEALYESYVRGGVEVLYEKLMADVNAPDEYISKLYDFLEEFDERYNQTIYMEQVLERCRKIKA